jgi:hypothetical protein
MSSVGFIFKSNEKYDKKIENLIQTLGFIKIKNNFFVSTEKHPMKSMIPIKALTDLILKYEFTTNFSIFFLKDMEFESLIDLF